jgi:hypothetical protein
MSARSFGLHQRHLVPVVTAGWAAGLVRRTGLRRGEGVLDVACGTGVVARAQPGGVRAGAGTRSPSGADASVAKRAEHALADAALLRTLAAEAGFTRIKIVTETRTVRFASVSAYVHIQLTATPWQACYGISHGGTVSTLAKALIADLAAALHPWSQPAGLAGRGHDRLGDRHACRCLVAIDGSGVPCCERCHSWCLFGPLWPSLHPWDGAGGTGAQRDG